MKNWKNGSFKGLEFSLRKNELISEIFSPARELPLGLPFLFTKDIWLSKS